jgi:hypothetical protein
VQVIELLQGGTGTVFRLRDPSTDMPHLYVVADGHGYRRVDSPPVLH